MVLSLQSPDQHPACARSHSRRSQGYLSKAIQVRCTLICTSPFFSFSLSFLPFFLSLSLCHFWSLLFLITKVIYAFSGGSRKC